jgi:hypothetical protein
MKQFAVKISAVLLTFMFAFPAFSQITLKYNLKKGETYRQNTVNDIKLTQKIMDQEIQLNVSTSMKTVFDVKDVQEDSYTLEMRYKEIKIDVAAPGGMGNITFDSNTPEDIATMQDAGPMLKAIVDKPVEVVMAGTGKVESVKGFDKFIEAMNSVMDENIPEHIKQQIMAQVGGQFSEEAFKAMFSQNSDFFPDKPVNTGDNWNVKMSATVSNFTIDLDVKITLKGIEGDVALIDMDGTVSTPEGFEQTVNGMTAKVMLNGTYNGHAKLNRNTGWVISSKISQNLAGEIEVMGMKVPLTAIVTTSVTDN